MDDGGQQMVPAVQAHVQRQHEAHQHLIGKHQQRLCHMEAVASECTRGF